MKINLHYIILIAIFAFTGIINSFGQENAELVPREYQESSIHKDVNDNEESISEEMLLKSQSNSLLARDSIFFKGPTTSHQKKGNSELTTPPKANENSKQEKNKEDKNSILSFNFIYYIFQKFKLSDIVDK